MKLVATWFPAILSPDGETCQDNSSAAAPCEGSCCDKVFVRLRENSAGLTLWQHVRNLSSRLKTNESNFWYLSTEIKVNNIFVILGHIQQNTRKNLLQSDLIREVLLSVRLIYVAGLSSCCICIMVTLGIRLGHLWDTCTWSQRDHGSLPITPPQLILPIKNHLYLSLDLSGCSTSVIRPCTPRFYLLSQIVVWIGVDFVWGPADYRRWLVVGCNPFSPSLSKKPLGYARLPEDRQHGRWILLPLFLPF